MSSSVYQVKEHTLECQHIREYARATANRQEDVLHLAIKQYIPLGNLHPKDGDITIIAAHANGFPKELYEPLWDDLYARSKTSNFRIRGIWIADIANQGMSGVLNEQLLGNDPSWNDHARDLLHMINHFRASMPMPLVGIGHSLGGNMLVNLSLIHPRLLSTLILLDPVIQAVGSHSSPGTISPVQASTFRRDVWPSREAAEAAFRKGTFYQKWDPRVLDRWCKYGVREMPTAIYQDSNEGSGKAKATLTTTKHQECFTFSRPSWEGLSEDGKQIINRDAVPDMSIGVANEYPIYRAEPPNVLRRLGEVRPSVLYIFGGASSVSPYEARNLKMARTGIGHGGSGGVKAGRVKEIVLKDVGHLVAMEASDLCAEAACVWLSKEAQRFEEEKGKYLEWTKNSLEEKATMSKEWQKRVGGDPGLVRLVRSKI